MKKIEVVAGIIFFENEILCTQRSENIYQYISNKFEFPGGKIEPNETKKEALRRELIEELNIIPKIKNLFMTVNHKYPDFNLTMHSYICFADSKIVKLNEHIDFKWLKKGDLLKLDWAAADIPIVNRLMEDK